MKLIKRTVRTMVFVTLLGGVSVAAISCDDSNSGKNLKFGTVSGVVIDDSNLPVSGAKITVSGMSETVLTGADGAYSVANVSNERHAVSAEKDGYVSSSKTVRASSFIDGKVTDLDLSLVRANSKIYGLVLDGRNGNVPLKGVVVRAGTGRAETNDEGKFEVSKLGLADYAVTFTYGDYPVVTINAAKNAFQSEEFDTGTVYLGGGDLLKTFDRYELAESAMLIYDDYRAGNASLTGAFGDWSTAYMSAVIDKYGNVEYQSEGLALRPSENNGGGSFAGVWDNKNERDDLTIPEDLTQFKCFIFGRKIINATNCKLTVRVRCHQAPSTFGVQVIDLNVPSPVVKEIAHYTHPNDQYINYNFDLSDYVGKEIVVVVGQYRDFANNSGTATNYWHQLPVARLAFSDDYLANNQVYIAGTEIIDGWKLTRTMVANAGVQTLTSFSGMSPEGAGNNHGGIARWYKTNHLGAHWALVSIAKDLEPVRNEGFIMKTSGDAKTVNTLVPASFLYAKFPIAAGRDKMVFMARTMSNTDTFFKFAVLDKDGNFLKFINPSAGAIGSAGPDNTWKFNRNSNEYANFEFDLSAYDGQTVTVAFGVIKGEANTEENKLTISSIVLQ